MNEAHPIVSIIILTYNNLHYTCQCLESIYQRTEYPDFEIIIVDNLSTDGTREFLQDYQQDYKNIKLILNGVNRGFATGNNQGTAIASGEYLIFLNNDTIVTSGWVTGLIHHLQDESIGMVGPVTNISANECRIKVDYEQLEEMEDFATVYTQTHAGEALEVDMLAFFCVALRRSVFDEIGPLDERFGIGMFEDDDYSLRVRNGGWKIICAEDVFVHHWGSASFSKLDDVTYRRLFEENREKFREKWGQEWEPPLYRPSLQKQQLLDLIDDAAYRMRLLAENKQKVEDLQAELDQIYSSTTWNLVQRIWSVRLSLIPPGSSRARAFKRIWNGLLTLKRRITPSVPARISWPAFAFYRFKEARTAIYAPDMALFSCPVSKGLVSIVLPVYNGERFVNEAIESILAQTYTNFELILVDDGSTDTTPKILEAYAKKDERIQVISQDNKRLPIALNTGFKFAQGEYLTWTSADNRLEPIFLTRMIDCLQRFPEWDMVYANVNIINVAGEPLRESGWYQAYQTPPGSDHIYLPENTAELNLVANNYVGAAFMYRHRMAFLLGDFSPFRFGTEDYDFWMRGNALLTLRHADFPEPVYDYRFHAESLTSQDDELGITRSREGLMVFEDARRDFYLSPLAWFITFDKKQLSQGVAMQIREWAMFAGHLLLDEMPFSPERKYSLWYPLAAVEVTSDPANAYPDPSWPKDAYKILVATEGAQLSDEMASVWDLCIILSGEIDLPSLPEARLGWARAADINTLCTAIDIRVKSAHLARLEAEIMLPPTAEFCISVVICTYRRGPQLVDAIRSVTKQTFKDYEIIVVNNDLTDTSVHDLITQLQETDLLDIPNRLRLIESPFRGLSFARNAGISEARGEIVSFLDDDAIALPDWLEQVYKAFQDFPDAGVVGGTIHLKPPVEKPRWVKPKWEYLWSHYEPRFTEAKCVEEWSHFPWGANWSASRQALLKVGGFRSRYGRKGVDFGGGEELIAASLIQRLGYKIIVAPNAKVYHNPHPSRYTLKHIWKTVRASRLSEYQQQIDFYLPNTPNLKKIRDHQWQYLSQALFGSGLKSHQRFLNLLYVRAYSLVKNQLRNDLRKRAQIRSKMGSQMGSSQGA